MLLKKATAITSTVLAIIMFFTINIVRADIVGYNAKVAVPVFSWLDHTYACLYGSVGCYSTGPSGYYNISGGSVVTSGYATNSQINQAACYATFCSLTYGVHGVCHQHTNRVLYPISRELNTNVRGYATSRWIYGTKGTNWWGCYCAG